MSYGPWPFVIVALGSLGFLANSMAQQQQQFSNAFDDGGLSSRRSGLSAPPLSEPNFGNSDFDEFLNSTNPGARFVNQRRTSESNPEIARITAVQESPNARTKLEPISDPVGAGIPAYGDRRYLNQSTRFPSRRMGEPTLAEQPGNGLDQQTIQNAQFETQNFPTKKTSMFRTPQSGNNASVNRSLNGEQNSVNGQSTDTTTGDRLGAAVDGVIEDTTATLSATAAKVPLWLTLGLFFSVGANIFFGYIAMNLHSRYQDLVEDMHESTTRSERRTRRKSSLQEDPPTPALSRQRDEEAFLNGGIEV